MQTAREMYPGREQECDWTNSGKYFEAPGDYGPILASIGEILLQVDDEDYQGDSRVIYRDGERVPLDVAVGDVVLFGKYDGVEIEESGEEFVILREDDVLGVEEA